MKITKNNIQELKEYQIFVFGSNENGDHIGGAAKLALDKFGAEQGNPQGLQGKSYAIVTMSGLDTLRKEALVFIEFAKRNQNLEFLLTEVGCGIAGYKVEQIAPLFVEARLCKNISIPESFVEIINKTPLLTYKGFDKDLKCRNFQYEIGNEYSENKAEACSTGFHACINPFDVFKYYDLKNGNRFCNVEQYGNIDGHHDDSKVASTNIKISGEIGFKGIIDAGIKFIFDRTIISKSKNATSGDNSNSATSGYNSNSATSGEYSNSATSGDNSHSATSGKYSHSATSGDNSHSATSGDISHSATSGKYSHSATSGKYSNSATSGEYSNSATSGKYSNSATSGDNSHSATSGDNSNSATSGDNSNSATSGYNSHSATSGKYSNSATSGDNSHSATSGKYSNSATSGYNSHSATSGKYSNSATSGENSESEVKDTAIAAAIGINSKAKGELGCWIVVSEWKYENNEYHIVCVKTAKVDGINIKANTFYKVVNEQFVEA